jgi:hypothetical protein
VIKSRITKVAEYVVHMGEITTGYILVIKPEEETLLGRPSSRWEDNY